jgi:hypothetical protein
LAEEGEQRDHNKAHRQAVRIKQSPAYKAARAFATGILFAAFCSGLGSYLRRLRWEREGVRLIDQRALRVAIALDAVPGLLGHKPPGPGGFGTGGGSVKAVVLASASMRERAVFIGSISVWDTIGTLRPPGIEIFT